LLGDPIPTLALPLKEREVGCNDFNKLKAHFQMKKSLKPEMMGNENPEWNRRTGAMKNRHYRKEAPSDDPSE